MSAAAGRRPWYRLPASWMLALCVGITLLAIIVQTWWTVAADRQLVLDAEKRHGLVAVRLLEEHARQTFEAGTRKLGEVAASVRKQPGDLRKNPELLHRLLAAHDLYGNPNLKALQHVDLQGRSWITSPDYPAHQSDISERDYVRALLARPDIEHPLVGHPYPSRYDSQLALPLARNLFDAQGRHLGLISVDIRLDYFSRLYARTAKEDQASVAIISTEGFIIVRSPFEARYADRDISQEQGLQDINSGPIEGSFEASGFLDDELPRLYVYRKVAGLPVATLYGRELSAILQAWQQRTRERVGFSATIVVLIALLSWFLQRYIRSLQRSRRSLLESESRFSRLFQLSPVPLTWIRWEGSEVLAINDAWSEQYGFASAEIVGRPVNEFGLWQSTAERDQVRRELAASGKLERREVRLRHRDGRSLICLLSARIFEAGGEQQAIFNTYDITRMREVEDKIRELNAELEVRVDNRTQNLARSNHDLSAALQSLQNMQKELVRGEKLAGLGALVAGIAHELNTPIGNALVVASTINEHTQSFDLTLQQGALRRSKLISYVKVMKDGSDILMRTMTRAADLISSFKQVAVDQTSDVRRHFDLATVLGELLTTLEPGWRKSNFGFDTELESGIEMESFPGALSQVISNLVGNSMAHGFEGRERGRMHISARRQGDNFVTLVYRDDGVGIPAANLAKVFDPFFTTKLGKGGSGLGLHIVYNIVTQVLGGSITLGSAAGQGVEIVICVPLVAPVPKAHSGVST